MIPPGRRRATEYREQMRALEPKKPWLWRRDWGAGHVEFTNPLRPVILMWVFALMFTATVVGVGAAFRTGAETASPAGLGAFFVVFLLASLMLTFLAARSTLSHIRHGRSVLELGQVPFVLGDRVHGSLHAPAVLGEATSFRIALTCLEQRETSNETPWSDELAIPRAEAGTSGRGLRIPFSIPVPRDRWPTSDDPAFGAIVTWRVSVAADVPGVDYEATFDVPVFSPEELPEGQRPATPAPAPRAREGSGFERPAAEARGYRFESIPEGVRIAYPPVRGPVGCLAFTFVLLGLTAAATQAGAAAGLARLMLPWMAGVVGLGLLVALADLLIDPRRIEVRREGLALRRSALGWTHETHIAAGRIKDVTAKSSRAEGEALDWSVDVEAGDRSYRVARALKDGAEAKWLAEEIRRLLSEHAAR